MPQILTKAISPNDLLKQQWLHFLNNREGELATAVQVSQMMQAELTSTGYNDIKRSLSRSLCVPESKIHFYGSRVMGLANSESDLDIYIEMEDSFYKGLSKESQQRYLDGFKVKLRTDNDWRNIVEVRDATVPILLLDFVGNPSSIKCEISVCDGIGVMTSKLMAHLFAIQPYAIQFFHFIRIWMKLAECEFKGFQLAVLVLFFLQTRGFIPGVNRVQKKLAPVPIRGWNVQFNQQRGYNCNPWIYFKRFVLRFFTYYNEFNYESRIIFPHLGVPVPKVNLASQPLLQKLPEDKQKFQTEKPIATAAPFACDYNITQDVSEKKLLTFKETCKRSIAVLRPVRKF